MTDQNHVPEQSPEPEQPQNHVPEQSPEPAGLIQRVSLHKAALQGNWENAEKLIQEDPSLANAAITEGGETALHLAAAEGHTYFVEQLMEKMSNLHIKNKMQKTPFFFAATAGHVHIAKVISKEDENFIRREGAEPLFFAAWLGHKEMANYLFEKSDFRSWSQGEQSAVLVRCIHSGFWDLAVKMIEINNSLAMAENPDDETPLKALATNPSAFRDTSQQGFRCNIASTILSCFKREARNTSTPCDVYTLLDSIWDEVIRQEDIETTQLGERIKDLLFAAAKSDNDCFTIELIKRYPDFIYKTNDLRQSIFHIAILQRSAEVFSLTYELSGLKDIIILSTDNKDNNILHAAATLPHQNKLNTIPGAALQMQREIMWYKEVEKIAPPRCRNMKNEDGKTPHELFLKEHDRLMKEGEKQIKQIAKSCMLVTTLITTIVFTALFTAPGGYNDKGVPILRYNKLFKILPISQAIATLASLISMLMFLSVLTSRYLENDFLISLPLWLVVGIGALFLSIVAMMVAFCSCLFFYKPGLGVMVVLLVLFASVPITFLILKFQLLFTILRCTCSSKWIFRSKRQLFS